MGTTELSEFPDGIPSDPDFPLGKRPLHEYVARYAAERPDSVAIDYYGARLTYGNSATRSTASRPSCPSAGTAAGIPSSCSCRTARST